MKSQCLMCNFSFKCYECLSVNFSQNVYCRGEFPTYFAIILFLKQKKTMVQNQKDLVNLQNKLEAYEVC